MAGCDIYGLLATFMSCLRNVYGSLRRVWLFATCMAVCDVYGCLRRLWLFATFMAVCDVYELFVTFMNCL